MPSSILVLVDNLAVPTILFFVLGLIAAVVRSDLTIPSGAAKFMSLYLLLAIGFKGGHSLADHSLGLDFLWAAIMGIVLSFGLPFLAYGLLRTMTRLDRLNAAAVAGHYGSISIVTFVAASNMLELQRIAYQSYMIAIAALMEVPAILSALWIARRATPSTDITKPNIKELLANGSIVLLVGAFAIGALTQDRGMDMIAPFVVGPFTGILCIFMLDMGLSAGRNLIENRGALALSVFGFGALMPLISATLAYGGARVLGLETGNTFLLMVLAASASYIAVPAAMRVALPQAQAGVYLTLSLGVTFPFNIMIGLPLYLWIAGL